MKKSPKENRSSDRQRQRDFSGNGLLNPNPRVGWYQGANAHEGHRGQKHEDEVLEVIRTQPIKTETRIKELYLQRLGLIAGKTKAELKVIHNTPAYKKVDDELHKLKERLFGWTPSGFCLDGRNDDGLLEYNGRVLVDFDKLPSVEERERIFQLLIHEKYIRAVWRSISGYGVKALACCSLLKKEHHKANFNAVSDRMFTLTGYRIDRACSNPSRFSFVAHDPKLFRRDAAKIEVFEVSEPMDEDTPPSPPISEDRLARLKAWIEKDGRVGRIELAIKDGKQIFQCQLCACSRPHKDVIIYLEGTPHLACFHPESCHEERIVYNEALKVAWTEIFYDDWHGRYFIRAGDDHEKWIIVNETGAKAELERLGVVKTSQPKLTHSIRRYAKVDYVGSLAGYKSGIHAIFEKRVLVIDSPMIIKPARGQWTTLRKFFEGVWDNKKCPTQLSYLYGWILLGHQAVSTGKHRPGQALVLAGERDSGKSLTQKLITLMLGGRVGNPYQYITGATPFNADLFGAEHLAIGDQKGSPDLASRRAFGDMLKSIIGDPSHHCHGKHARALELTPLWRLSISLNNEDESLHMLPPMDAGIEDKVILLLANKGKMPMPTKTIEQYERFFATLKSEIPAFLYYLIHEWKMPKVLLTGEGSNRFGMAHFHHPYILESLRLMAPESKLLTMIDDVLFPNSELLPIPPEPRVMTAIQVERELKKSDWATDAGKLLRWHNACGTYLSRLAQQYPKRIKPKRVHADRLWVISPPLFSRKPAQQTSYDESAI